MQNLNDQIVEVLPHLERYARHLAQDRDEAQDLVQDCVERALMKSDLYCPDTNLRAWMFTMMRNLFIKGTRRKRVAHTYAENSRHDAHLIQLPRQNDAVMLSETMTALRSLSDIERQAVIMLGIEQRSHNEVAKRTRLPVGTLKSRLSRGRAKLRAIVDGAEERELPASIQRAA